MLLRTLTTVTLLTIGALAQTSSFPKPSYFRETFSKSQTQVELKHPVRLKDYVHGDKLELSLKDYLALVMANNTDIAIQMLSLEMPKNAIQRAFGAWDPRAIAQFTTQRATSPSTSALDGASTVKSLSQPLTMSVTQTLDTGTSYIQARWGGTKTTTNSNFNSYNPALSSNVGIGCGPCCRTAAYVNRSDRDDAAARLRTPNTAKNQLLGLVSAAQSAYWDVVSAREASGSDGARDVSAEFLKSPRSSLSLARSPVGHLQSPTAAGDE